TVLGDGDFVALFLENLFDQGADVGFVIHDQYVRSRHIGFLEYRMGEMGCCRCGEYKPYPAWFRAPSCAPVARRSRMRTTAPPPAALSAWITPPCSSTIFLTIARPSPVPLSFVVT